MAISNNVTRINMRPEDNIDWRNEATENKDISKNDYIGSVSYTHLTLPTTPYV